MNPVRKTADAGDQKSLSKINPKEELSNGMKFAVVEIAGKQYLVSPQMKIKTEKLTAPLKGAEIKFDKVLLAGDGDKISVGQPAVKGAEVKAEILGDKRAKKIVVFRYRPKARVRVKRGHRQHYSELLIKDIKF